MSKVESSGAGGRSLGDEKRGTEVESTGSGSGSVGGVGRDPAKALEPEGRSVVGAEHALSEEVAGAAAGGRA
jgi:hypothetical protein